MIGITVIGAEGVARRLEAAGRRVDAAEKAVAVKGSILVRKHLVQHMTGKSTRDAFWGKRSPLGAYLGARTGQSRARISPGGKAFKQGGRWIASVGSPDAHVKMQDQGGTVHGRQYLRIPTAAAQTPGGQDRNAGRSLRDLPGLYLFRSHSGKLWAAVRPSGDSQPILLYLLVRQVKLRARHFFAAVEHEVQPLIAALGNAEVATVVRAANG